MKYIKQITKTDWSRGEILPLTHSKQVAGNCKMLHQKRKRTIKRNKKRKDKKNHHQNKWGGKNIEHCVHQLVNAPMFSNTVWLNHEWRCGGKRYRGMVAGKREERFKRKESSEHNWTFLCFLFLSGLEGGERQDLGHMVIIPSEIPSVTPTPHPIAIPSLLSKPSLALSA